MIRVIPFVALLVLSSFSLCGCGGQTSWEKLQLKAERLLQEGKYDQAIKPANRAIEEAERTAGKDRSGVAKGLTTLGRIYEKQKKYAQAEPLFKLSLEMWEKALSANHPDLSYHLGALSQIYVKQGKYAQAEPLAERNLEIQTAKLGPDDPLVNMQTSYLAEIYEKQGKKREAYKLLKAARLIPGKESAKEPARVASAPQKSSQSPSVTIHEMKANPSTVRGGAKFTLSFDYTVADSKSGKAKLPIEISYSLRQGGKTFSEQPPVRSEVEKGKKLHTDKTIGAPRKSGSYELGVRIQSQAATAEKVVPLKIR
jgi:tetratricopeptide (TPR) repeat protein